MHLGYCMNVHAGERLDEMFASLRQIAAAVRAALSWARLGLGLYAFTCNGFPFGGFHAERVKEAVYRPDWTAPERLAALPEGSARGARA